MIVHLRKINPEENQYRFYSLHITPTLFGEWALVREWGRIGSGGRVRSDWFDTEEEAVLALEDIEKLKSSKAQKGERVWVNCVVFQGEKA